MTGSRLVTTVRCLAIAAAIIVAGCAREDVNLPVVTVTSEPESGAQVLVGGEFVGTTPVTIEHLPPGPTGIEVILDGYKPANELIQVPSPGDKDLAVLVELKPLVGFVTFETEPELARVYLDGTEFLGETPLVRVPVSVGEHQVEFLKANYEPLRASLTVEEDYIYEHRHQLTPMKSSLSVLTVPTGADVWINEALQEHKTPLRVELPPGRHSVSVHAKGFVTTDESFTLNPAEQKTIELRLAPGDVPPNMVLIPAGEFIMGSEQSPHERPPRKVMVDTFYIDRFEVTNQDFKTVFTSHTFAEGDELLPASGVTWNQAQEYASALGKRLPTEAEWEKAARGVEGRVYPWGNEFQPDWCTTAETFGAVLKKVGYHREGQSPFGCMDMVGNVYEWTGDWYRAYPGNTEISKDYGQVYRVLRGGSYESTRFAARCAARHYDKQESARPDYGFRCAKDAQ